jgi:hypothetical protein
MRRIAAALSIAAWRVRLSRRPIHGACALGPVLAVFSLALSWLTLALLHVVLPRSYWGPSAAAGLGGLPSATLFLVAVLPVPLVETFIGQVLPIEMARRLGFGSGVQILASAVLFGAGHFLNGGLAHGATTFSAGLVFAFGYVLARPNGFRSAALAAWTTHATHNVVLLLMMQVFPQWA